jgi:hypothetical protein
MEDKFKPEPTEEEIQVAEKLLPKMEDLLYANPEKVADVFLNTNAFRELLLSRIPPEELAKAEKIAKEQNTTTDEIIKKNFVEIIKKHSGSAE